MSESEPAVTNHKEDRLSKQQFGRELQSDEEAWLQISASTEVFLRELECCRSIGSRSDYVED